jgi:hypothetical protein
MDLAGATITAVVQKYFMAEGVSLLSTHLIGG